VSDVFLGIIAAAVLVMAAIQVAAALFAARAVRRLERLADWLEQDIRPVIVNLQGLSTDAARATALATAQIERADRLFADLARRLEETLAAVHETLVTPAREGLAWLNGLKTVLAAIQELRGAARPRRSTVDEDDALFIG
jgi:hypothetical protein